MSWTSCFTASPAAAACSLSTLERVDEREFGYLLAWIGRAYESSVGPDGDPPRSSIDGRATIVLRAPADPLRERTRLRAPHGTLELPDFTLEVVRR